MALMSAVDRAFVDATVAQVQASSKNQGFVIDITGPAGDYKQKYGLGDRRPETPIRQNDHFRIGSTSKSFLTRIVLQEIDKKTLFTPVSGGPAKVFTLDCLLSDFVAGVPQGNVITVRNLLMMRSGVYDYQTNPGLQFLFTLSPTWPITEPDSHLNYIKGNPSQFPPDSKFNYTNSNFILLGVILGVVTGKNWKNLIQDRLLTPLGLTETFIPTGPTAWMLPEPWSHGFGGAWFDPTIDADQTAINPALFGAAGMMVSNTENIQRWGQALRDGYGLSPEMHAFHKDPANYEYYPYDFEGPSIFGYGLGQFQLDGWFGHDGSVPGFSTNCMYEPISGAVFAGFENYQSADVAIFSRVFRRVAKYLYPGTMA